MSLSPPRDWTAIRWPEIGPAEPARWIAVLPLAATEQHGPHLPLGTDVMIAQAYLARVHELLPEPLPATLVATQATDLSRMPATVIASAGIDPLCDESEVYAARLREAGCAVELQVFETLPHGFCAMAGAVESVAAAVEKTIAAFAALLR